jgi:hypothetical protein
MDDSETKQDRSKVLGQPPLVRGENEEDYNALREHADVFISPITFMGDLTVRDLTDDVWEQQRYKRYQTNLIESGFQQALVKALTQIHQNDEWRARNDADKWFRGSPEERGAIGDLLKQFGFSIDMLCAEAMASKANSIALLERMICNRKSSRLKIVSDHEKSSHLHVPIPTFDE